MKRQGRVGDIVLEDNKARKVVMRAGIVIDRPSPGHRTVLVRTPSGPKQYKIDNSKAGAVTEGRYRVRVDRRHRVVRNLGLGTKVLVELPEEGRKIDLWVWNYEVNFAKSFARHQEKILKSEYEDWPEPYQEGGPIVPWNPNGVIVVFPLS